eukprot:COSAG01_NODE_399_length_17543_cov_15.077792_17_plen_61_part_00
MPRKYPCIGRTATPQPATMHSVPGADLSDWDDYEINLDQRVLSPEICMAACMAGRPAGWR